MPLVRPTRLERAIMASPSADLVEQPAGQPSATPACSTRGLGQLELFQICHAEHLRCAGRRA